MIGGEAARRYAKALMEIALSQNVLDETGEELNELARVVRESADLQRVLMNPRFARSARVQMLDGVLESSGASELVRNFARVVAEKDRIAELPAMAVSYQSLADEQRGRVRAQVRAAYDMDAAAVEKLRAKIAEMTGSEVLLEVEKDENLIGGLVCRVGGVVMDGSIRNQLRNLRDTLTTN